MYQADAQTGETIFMLTPPQPAKQVFLVSHDDPTARRVPMQSTKGQWMTRLKLRASLFVYRFEVDGRACWDRDAGKVKFSDGEAWSLATISGQAFQSSDSQQSAFA